MITMENYGEIQNAINFAKQDDTPIVAVTDDEISVLGDPNKTQKKVKSYRIRFAFPKTADWIKAIGQENIEKSTENYIVTTMEFKNVTITPRLQAKVVSSFVELYSFFQKVEENGAVVDPTLEDIRMILSELSNDIEDKMYNAVSSVLGISAKYTDYMVISDVIRTTAQLIVDFPEILNEADLFFA